MLKSQALILLLISAHARQKSALRNYGLVLIDHQVILSFPITLKWVGLGIREGTKYPLSMFPFTFFCISGLEFFCISGVVC